MIQTAPSPRRPRWQPPALHSPEPEPLVRVDEAMVRRMLKINPGARAGRSTQKIKQALERGDALTPTAATLPSRTSSVSPLQVANEPKAIPSPKAALQQALNCFVGGQFAALTPQLKTIDQKITALQYEKRALHATAVNDLVNFIALLTPENSNAPAQSTQSLQKVISTHPTFLQLINVDAATIVDQVARTKS